MIRITWDLEMHNDGPSDQNKNPKCYGIIQLGYTIFSTEHGILETGGDYIKTGLPLSPYIKKLTGITEKDITEQGVSLHEAFFNMNNALKKYLDIYKSNIKDNENVFVQPVFWGNDMDDLKQELFEKQYENVLVKDIKPYQELVYFKEPSVKLDTDSTLYCKIKNNYDWIYGYSYLNLKAVYQMYMEANKKPHSAGLGKSLKRLGYSFEPYKDDKGVLRGQHDARADSYNTARMYLLLRDHMVKGQLS